MHCRSVPLGNPPPQRRCMCRSFQLWSECVFRSCFARDCILNPLTVCFSARERNAVWLLEKARKINTKALAGAVPDSYWIEPGKGDLSTAAEAEPVRNFWDIAARVPKNARVRGRASHYFAPPSDDVPYQRGTVADDSAARVVTSGEPAQHRARELGEGMERLRLCVSLLQKQVHVSARQPPSTLFFTRNFTFGSQMVRKVSVQRVRLPNVKFLLNSQG
jgi:hypothetical protein